jgi:hypothetical protein
MGIEDINPASAIAGAIGGLFAFYVSGTMMPENFLIRIATFAVTTVACYFVFDKVLEG